MKSIVQRLQQTLEPKERAMWKVFLASVGLLALAMLAALFSSSAAREGRTLSAVISAVVALAIALWVGVRFVPRLASNVDWDWLPYISHYQITREGWAYFGTLIVVMFACVNTSNNLLYMVLSALLAVVLLSGFLSGFNFRRLKIDLRIPDRCFAGESFPISLKVHNQKRLFPSFSLNVDPKPGAGIRFESFYLPSVPARSHGLSSSVAVLWKRGKYKVSDVSILSRYPFGFFVKGRDYAVEAECICYPEILPREQINLAAVDVLGSRARYERGLGYDLYMIRNYIPSDGARHVHWKASAKTAALKTREFAAEDARRMTLYLDRFAGIDDFQPFEKLVSFAGSLAYHLIHDGVEVALATDEWSSGYGGTESHIETILYYLATVQKSKAAVKPSPETAHGALVLSIRKPEMAGV